MQSDEAFRALVEAADAPEDKHRVLTEAGYDVTPDDLVTIKELLGISELSDEDLESVAAGMTADEELILQIGLGGGTVVVAVVAAVAVV
jgi:predicted ribosomally synthesized peptide with nif11-like leader